MHRLGALAYDALDVFTDRQAVRDSNAQYTDWRNTLNVRNCGGWQIWGLRRLSVKTISTHLTGRTCLWRCGRVHWQTSDDTDRIDSNIHQQSRCTEITSTKVVVTSLRSSFISTIDTTQEDAISLLNWIQFECRFLRRLQMSEMSCNRLLMFATQYKYI